MIANQQPAAATPFQSASLYVGDLHNEVTEVSFLIPLSCALFLVCFNC